MSFLRNRAIAALKAYYERGLQASERLSAQDIEEASRILTWRKAAFYNFRVTEVKLKQHGIDISQDPVAKDYVSKITKIDEELMEQLQESSQMLSADLRQVAGVKGIVGKFQSERSNTAGVVYSRV